MSGLGETIVALATPPGVGAIAVIRLSGPKAIDIANGVFPSKDLNKQPSHTVHFGTIRDGKTIVDEVLVTLFVGPNSYTGENVVEVSCHASDYIIKELLALFIRGGARTAQAGEFTLRAFLNGKMDLSQAEAVADLIASSSKTSHELAMQQMRGGFSNEIQQLRAELIDFASLIELELDFGEEDVEFADRTRLMDLMRKIQGIIKKLIDSFRLGNVLKNGVTTVIAGRPNAGKSTLLNAMLKEERAIVSDIAGTTRDTIEEVLNIQGINYRLIDTAGIRDAKDQIEAVGVEKTFEKIRQSSILLYVFDVAQLSAEEVKSDLQQLLANNIECLVLANKTDLNPDFIPSDYVGEEWPDNRFISLSAKEKTNVDKVKDYLYQAVIHGDISAENTIVSNARHYDALNGAYESLTAAINNLEAEISADFVAMDIRRSLYHLGEITGEISTDDLLDNIFSNFCIGK